MKTKYLLPLGIMLLASFSLIACSTPAQPETIIEQVEVEVTREVVSEVEVVREVVSEVEVTRIVEKEVEASMAESQEPVEIEFWTLLSGGQGEILAGQVDAFNASQDRVNVTLVEQGGYSGLQQKLLASISAGNTPAVTMVDYVFVPFYAQQGVFEPLDKYFSDADKADFIPGLLSDLNFQGELYALPYSRSTQGLYYNADLLGEVGIDSPADSWEEFEEHSRLLHDANPDYYGSYSYFNRWYWEPVMLSFGGQLNDADCNVTINGAESVEAMEFFRRLQHDEGTLALPTTLEGSVEEREADFIQGRIAYILKSTSWLTRMDDVVDFDWGFTLLPEGPGGRFVTNGGGNLAISASATDAEKAAGWELIHFLSNTQQTAELHGGTGYVATRYSALDLPWVKTLHDGKPEYRVSVDQLEFAQPTACVARNVGAYHPMVSEALQRIVINNEDPQTVLDQLTADLQFEIDAAKEAGTLVP